ncbi:MAG: lipopolysaccharide transport periplasmic protein LptA [Coxiellaceae bacterium]|nr:MAG: lipopolysaccharide transport periplasmic protein LptA [Coxiellaceae bacterium]
MPSLGLVSDKTQTAYIQADRAEYNQKIGISTYYGNVKIDQGSTHLRGDKMIVYNSSDHKTVSKIIAFGNLARYSTLPENQTVPMDAQAKTIEYYPTEDRIVLIGAAVATQGKNTVTGETIEYQMTKQMLISSPAKASRTVIVFQPE